MGPVTVRPSHLQELEERLFYGLGTMLKPLTKMCMGKVGPTHLCEE